MLLCMPVNFFGERFNSYNNKNSCCKKDKNSVGREETKKQKENPVGYNEEVKR